MSFGKHGALNPSPNDFENASFIAKLFDNIFGVILSILSKAKYLYTNDIINYYLLKGKKINVSPTGAFYKTKIMKEAFEFGLDLNDKCLKKGIGIDLIMNFYPVFKNEKVYFTSESLVNCRAHDSSITVKTDNRVLHYCYLKYL